MKKSYFQYLTEFFDEKNEYSQNKYHIFIHDTSHAPHFALHYESVPTLSAAKDLISNELKPTMKDMKHIVASVVHHPEFNGNAEDLFRKHCRVQRTSHDGDEPTFEWEDTDPGKMNSLVVHAEHLNDSHIKKYGREYKAKAGDTFNPRDMSHPGADNPYGSLFGNDEPTFADLDKEE